MPALGLNKQVRRSCRGFKRHWEQRFAGETGR